MKDINEVKYGRKVKRIATFEVTQEFMDAGNNFLLYNCSCVKNIKVNGVLTEPDENNQIVITEIGTYEVEMEFKSNKFYTRDVEDPDGMLDGMDGITLFTSPNLQYPISSLISLNDDFFVGMKNLPLLSSYISNINIPNSIEDIALSFFYAAKLSKINIPNSVKYISGSAFAGAGRLNSENVEGFFLDVDLPDTIQYIGTQAFYYSGLKKIIIPDSVLTIGDRAFHYCGGLESVVIGSGITDIGGSAFSSCPLLSDITCLAETPPTLGAYVFNNNAASGVLKVPTGSDYSTWLTYLGNGWTIEYI